MPQGPHAMDNSEESPTPATTDSAPPPVRLRWLRHAIVWLVAAGLSRLYVPETAAMAIALLGAVVTAYWERTPQITFGNMAAAAARHGTLIGLVVLGYYVLVPLLWWGPGRDINPAVIALWGLNVGFWLALGASVVLFTFYLSTWLAQQAWSMPQPLKSLPILAVLSIVTAAVVQTHGTFEQAPQRVRATNQELCERGEAPAPDPRQPILSACGLHQGEITAVRFTRDGQSLVSVGAGGYRLWNLSDQTLRTSIPGERIGNLPRRIILSADERSLLTTTEGQPQSLTVWNLLAGEPAGQYLTVTGDTLTPLAFGFDGRTILTFSKQQGLIVWDVQARTKALTYALNGMEWCDPFSSPTLRFIAVVCQHTNRRLEDTQFYVWDSQSRTILVPKLRVPQVYGAEFSDDERFLAVGTGGGAADFDFYETGTWTQSGPPAELAQLLRMRIELARGYGELFWLPDPRSDRKGYRINAYKVALSPDGNKKAVYPEGPYNLRLVDMQSGQSTDLCPPGCYGGSPILGGLAMSLDQHWLAVVHGGGISLWDLQRRQLAPSLHGLPPTKPAMAKPLPPAQEPPAPPLSLAEQCEKDVAASCYQQGLVDRREGRRTEASTFLNRACRLRGSYCLEAAKLAAKEGDAGAERRWLETACRQRDRQGCQEWMYHAERKGDESGVQEALFGRCLIDGEYCPSLLVKADKAGTTTQTIDRVCHATTEGCAALGKSLEGVQRLVHATRAYESACKQGHAQACSRKDELALHQKKAS